jgi:hypothetical protein
LKTSDIIPKHRREEFIDKVFSNLIDIHHISAGLTSALRARQQEHPIVSQVSDIMEHFVAEFEPFIYYGARQHQAKHTYEHERFNNPKFALFAEVKGYTYLRVKIINNESLYSKPKEMYHLANWN